MAGMVGVVVGLLGGTVRVGLGLTVRVTVRV
jgi:hypothetical protein